MISLFAQGFHSYISHSIPHTTFTPWVIILCETPKQHFNISNAFHSMSYISILLLIHFFFIHYNVIQVSCQAWIGTGTRTALPGRVPVPSSGGCHTIPMYIPMGQNDLPCWFLAVVDAIWYQHINKLINGYVILYCGQARHGKARQ